MIRIFLFYALSGFISLGYQVAWFRIFTDWFGSTNLTFAIVICNFIGGLAIGALMSQRIAKVFSRLALQDRLRIYGLLELLVGLFVLLTVLAEFMPADLWGSFPYHLIDGIWVQTSVYRISQIAVAATCVLIPCIFMGATFPLLCETFVETPEGGRFPAALYAWNTLGACTGVLACQFLLLPWLGHTVTLWLMIGLNLLLGAYFLAAGGEPNPGAIQSLSTGPEEEKAPVSNQTAGPVKVLFVFALISGLLSGALEGDLFKRISFVIAVHPGATMSFISFWAILAIFLSSALVHRFTRLSLLHIKIAFIVALAYFAVAARYIDAIMGFVDVRFTMLSGSALQGPNTIAVFPTNLAELFAFCGILIFPPYLLISLMLPYICIQMQSRKLKVGYIYGLNTFAFCIGLIGFTLIAPQINIFYSLKLFLLLFALTVLLLLVIRERSRLTFWQPAGFLVAFIAAALLTPANFDASYFPPDSTPALSPVRALKSNGANTTFVAGEGENSALYFGRLRMSANNIRAKTYMRLMAHYPLLLHPDPKKALLICFGAGNTAAAIATHDSIHQIDILDLNNRVFETSPEFASTNGNVHLDPRVRLIHDDGRNFLNVTDQTYDLITSEPPPPLAAGVYRLYSREYYEAALDHLNPDGLMSQWLPMYLLNPEVVDLAISTFLDVFPHTLIFTGFATDFILVGSRSPIDLSLLEKRFPESQQVVHDLASNNISKPTDLLARIIASDSELRDRYEGKPLILDEHNDLEHLFRDRARPSIIWYEPKKVLRYLKTAAPDNYDDLKPVLMHMGRLRYHVREFPFESLTTVRLGESDDVALANIDWIQIARQYRLLGEAMDADRQDQVISILERLLEIAEEQPEVLLALADFRIRAGLYEEALAPLQGFQKLEPDESVGYQLLGRVLMLTGRADEAIPLFRQAIVLEPGGYLPRIRIAWILATHPDQSRADPVEAIRLAETAAELTRHQDAEVLGVLAAAYASAGQFKRATEFVEMAIERVPIAPNDSMLDALRLHQRAYASGQSLADQSLQP
jgi:spermidine synthase